MITRARLWLFFGFAAGIAWQFYGCAARASRIAPRQASSPLPPVSLPKGNTAAPKFMLSSPFHRKLSPKATRFACAVVRGRGCPAHHVEASPLFGQVIQFYSCSSAIRPKTKEFATLIHADLQNNGVRCRFSPHHTKIGDKISRCDSTVGAATSRVAAWARDWLLVKRFFEPAMRGWQVIRQQR